MSADNWAVCPRCNVIDKENKNTLFRNAEDSYGKVDSVEYMRLFALAVETDKSKLEPTLREDWELGVDENGHFYVSYRCSCSVCKFNFSYKYEQNVPY